MTDAEEIVEAAVKSSKISNKSKSLESYHLAHIR